MIKKIIAGMLISAVTLFALPNNEVELLLVSKASEKKAIVLANMGLKDETKQNFGKLYDEYQLKLMKHRMDTITLISHYAKSYTDMTNENADKLITEWVSLDDTQITLKKEYVEKFKKIMPSVDVIRYFQIENRLQLLREVQISSKIPLAIPSSIQTEIK